MPYILSIVTFLPLVGAAAILLTRLAAGRAEPHALDNSARWIALTVVSILTTTPFLSPFEG